MAVCTECGTVLHPDDMESHVCDPADLPIKGTPKKPQFKVS